MAKDRQKLEIKFSAPMPVLSALPESAFIRTLTPEGGLWRRLEFAYQDTGDVAHSTPTEKGQVDQLLPDTPPLLHAALEVIIDRWRAEFAFKTSMLEVVADLGRVRMPVGRSPPVEAPLGEVGLRLLKGDPADLFLAARLMLDSAPLRLQARSKRETALLTASGRQFAAPAFTPFAASASDSAGDIFQRAVMTAAGRIIDLQPSILEARKPDGVHRMRVELRRFRAIERLFRRAADCPPMRRHAQRAGVIARALGPARDWDVFLDETLPAMAQNGYAIADLKRLKTAAYAHRAAAWAAASAEISDPAFSTFALDLLETAHLQPWRGKQLSVPAETFALRALDRTLRNTRKIARGIDPASPHSLHPLRIALKKLRYGVQLFRGIYPKAARKSYMAAMAAMQEALGLLNDAVTAQTLANRAAEGEGEKAMRAAGFICGYYAARAEAAAKEIDEAWAMFENKTPFWRQ